MIDMAKRCKVCKGKKVVRNKKKLTCEIDKGSPSGEQFTLHGEGDCVPDVEPGDVIVVIKVKEHPVFKRKGADLMIEKEITLLEALTGVDFSITHLDGREIRI
jgi:DnaJ family protein A protein 2